MIGRTLTTPMAATMLAVFVCLSGIGEGTATAQFGKLFGKGSKDIPYASYKDPAGRFTVDYPSKDWRVMPTPGASLAILAQNDFEATVVIDYKRLDLPLAPSDVTATFADVEAEGVRERQPTAKDMKPEIVDTAAGRGALLRYANTGVRGPERVIQFSIPVRQDLYRVIASMREALATKYDPIVTHIVQSFLPAGAASPK